MLTRFNKTVKIAETIRDWTKRSCDALHPDWIGWSALKYETVCETLAQRKVFTADLAKSLGNEVWPVTTKEFAHSRGTSGFFFHCPVACSDLLASLRSSELSETPDLRITVQSIGILSTANPR